jgi:glutathione S-transferase
MKLVLANGTCSIGIHVLLEEIGKPYDTQTVKLMDGDQYKPEFTALSPKSKVPVLVRDDGSVLTEFPAIAVWLARTNPDAHLLPSNPDGEARTLEALDYSVATIHMQGFARVFRPTNFSPNEADKPAVQARGKEIVEKGYGLLDKSLAGHDYVAGEFSIADAAAFYVSFWGKERLHLTLPANLDGHYARMRARPAVQRVMAAEGFA